MLDDRDASRRREALDTPLEARQPLVRRPRVDAERFGRLSEAFARLMGTPGFLIWMSVIVIAWLSWNSLMPTGIRFDPATGNFTLLTLILSLQASYAAPLILLAQNRQDDRDRVGLEQDRQRAERNLADTEYLAREVAALRIALGEVATRDFVRSELRALLEELLPDEGEGEPAVEVRPSGKSGKGKGKGGRRAAEAADRGADRPPEHPAEHAAEPADRPTG